MVTGQEIAALLGEALVAWSFDEASLAARAHLDLEATRAALAGAADVSDLGAVAQALGGSIDDLLAGRRFWEAPATAFKNAPTEFELPLVRAALLRVASAARDREALVQLLAVEARRHDLAPIAVAGDVGAQAEELAGRVRAALDNEAAPILSIREEMGRLGVATFLTDFGTEDVDGMAWRDDRGRAAAAANVRARGGKLTALRMTFAHELCHVMFDGTKLSHFGVVERRPELAEGREQRANAFAAHLLAPRHAVLRFLRERGLREGELPSALHVRSLSEHFGLGVAAVAGHLVSCGCWDKTNIQRYRGLFTRDAAGEDNAELHPSAAEACVALERRGALLDLATHVLERGEISVGRWRELLSLRETDDWRGLLDERQVARDVEHRSEV